METALVLEGSGEELLAQAERWRGRARLKLIEISLPTDVHEERLPDDVVWDGTIPLVPRRGRTEPITSEMVRAWLEEDE